MQFTYKATTKEGKTISGSAEAANKQALVALLRKQGVHPLLIEANKGKSKVGALFGPKRKVKLSDLVIFTRQLSTMISAGVPLVRSLAALQGDSANPYFREVLGGVSKEVEGGIPLGDAFAKYPNVFSDVYVNMVRAGEEGGILDEILKRLATQVEQDASIRKKIKSAMMYPMVILTITIIAFFGIMLFIVPKLGGILTSLDGPNAKLPVYTQVLLNFSNFCSRPTIMKHVPIPIISHIPNLILILIVFIIAATYILRYIRTPTGKYKFHALLLRTPIVKVIILKVAIARFSRTFASLMGAGVSVLDALDVTGAAIGNKAIEAELKAAAEEVKNGKQLSEPLGRSKHFPPIVSQMLMVGEETGQIDTVLVKIADFYEEEVAVLIDGLAAIIEPIMIIFLGAGVGLIAASVMGPIANLSKNIGSN
ncbi:MAG TPA: type II secretion system F family protein [Verrucomicrobiae bacterium]|jgi:type IV pilus assembly protein PilC|nr:type II secretion system F family protein [Verrucomicrobiae bacterium]